MEGLKLVLSFLTTAGIGALPPLLITAATSYLNRDTAKTQLEIERLRQQTQQ